MLLQRIKARNYRTYLNLDLDLSVTPERPLLLIGGKNGGGKTTLFTAIAGALYGLRIPDAQTFRQQINAGALAVDAAEPTIELELWFTGQILSQTQQYVLTRTWFLGSDGHVNWGVKLNMAGNITSYGSATPERDRQSIESQVGKIIKANLPKELSEYFLFDAMSAGQKLSEDQLGKVIRENIENVMGLRKYLDLGSAARVVQEQWFAERMSAKAERDEYLRLTEEQRNDEARLREQVERRDAAQDQLHSLRELVTELKESQNQEGVLKHRLDGIEKQKRDILSKEIQYRTHLDDFVKGLEPAVGLPQLARAMAQEVRQILEAFTKIDTAGASWNPEVSRELLEDLWRAIEGRGIDLSSLSRQEVLAELLKVPEACEVSTSWDWLEPGELRALEDLIRIPRSNPFPALDLLRQELSLSISAYPNLESQQLELKARLAGKDYSSLQRAEGLERDKLACEQEIQELQKRLAERARKIQQYDVTPLDEPDPRFEAAVRLKAWFEEAATELLKAKKRRIEECLCADLNRNLAAYQDVIDRVELSESLRNLSFRIFHKAGNEIYLGQLNAASKQVVIQVLLKALHESGDYDPPVMIDTVMGVLDKESRATILTNYFPSLSHQTILLSTDSEIEAERDFPLLAPYIGKAWTLVRNREEQKTDIEAGYFGVQVGEP